MSILHNPQVQLIYSPRKAKTKRQRESCILWYLEKGGIPRHLCPTHLAVMQIRALACIRAPMESLLSPYSLPQTMLISIQTVPTMT